MTLPEPAPALNPVSIEHRLTVVEEKLDQRLFNIAEQIGNLVNQMKIANGRTAKNEEAIRVESGHRVSATVALQDNIDKVADGIAERIKMEAAYKAGQSSITVKMPWKQFTAGVGLIAMLVGIVDFVLRLFA